MRKRCARLERGKDPRVWTMMDNGPDFLFPRGRVVSVRTLLQLLPNKSGTDQAESDQDSRK